MKSIKNLMSACVLGLCISSHAQDIQTGLLGHWKMNGDAQDETGQYHGTITDAIGATDQHNNNDGALQLDGDDYVRTNLQLGGMQKLSISVVFKATTLDRPSHKFVSQEDEQDVYNRNFYFGIIKLNNEYKLGLYLRDNPETKFGTSDISVDANVWHHAVGVWNEIDNIFKFYLDGNEVNANIITSTSNFSTIGNHANLNIGREYDINNSFKGKLNNIRIYDRALSEADVQQLYQEDFLDDDMVQNNHPPGWTNDGNGQIHTHDYLSINTDQVFTDPETNEQFELTVNGGIFATQVTVMHTPWPDYVFNKDYSLLPLEDLKTYIEQNGHLPNIPKQEDIERQGVSIGKMNALLMEKIEELTLYLLDLKSENIAIKKELSELQRR